MRELDEKIAVLRATEEKLKDLPSGDIKAQIKDAIEALRDRLIHAAVLIELKQGYSAEKHFRRANGLIRKINQLMNGNSNISVGVDAGGEDGGVKQ